MLTFIPIFNAYTGELYGLAEDDIKNCLEGEIPLVERPKSSCKYCHGRGYTGRDLVSKSYTLCPKCVITKVNPRYMRDIQYNTIKVQ